MIRPSARLLDAAGLVVRLGLAAVWLVSGVVKAVDLPQTRVAVAAYRVLPGGLVDPVATALPLLELALGTLLLVGAFTRWAATASAALLVVLLAGVVQAWARGLAIDCGCFGGGGAVAADDTRYPQEVARDTGFLLLAAWLVVRPRTALAADRWLAGRSGGGSDGAEGGAEGGDEGGDEDGDRDGGHRSGTRAGQPAGTGG